MRAGFAVLILGSLTFAGCGGGSPEVHSGVLRAGGAQGISYRTATQAGTTDSAGTFRYRAGETVTFSIGGIGLGSVPGAAEITLFQLAGLPPPSTEPALRLELDRATRKPTPFVRAINLQRLLIALDADHDPANGFDVRGRDAELAGASLQFDLRVVDFRQALERLTPRQTRNIPLWAPVERLYRSAGIQVSAHEAVRSDAQVNGQFEWNSITGYSSRGLRESSRQDYDGDGIHEFAYVETFDPLGRTLSSRRDTPNEPSDFTTHTYDARGNLTSTRRHLDYDANGTRDEVYTLAITLDANDRQESTVFEIDYVPADARVDSRTTTTITYDARGNTRTIERLMDDNADGTVTRRELESMEYNAEDRLVSHLFERYSEPGSVLTSRESRRTTYSDGGRVREETVERDTNADGQVEGITRIISELTPEGFLRRTRWSTDWDADGIFDAMNEKVVDNDADGRPLLEIGLWESDIELYRISRTYDSVGNGLSFTWDRDLTGDGIPERYQTTSEYGTDGELRSTEFTDHDEVTGLPASGSAVYVNEPFTDGVALLAQKYFDFSASF
jgi:hypothetical protein